MLFNKFIKIRRIKPLNIICYHYHTSSPSFGALSDSANAQLDKNIFDRYMSLPTPECKVQAKYIWIDGTGENMRCKTRTLDFVPHTYKELPNWSFDGSSTQQGDVKQSDCHLIPVAMYNDPIRRGNNKLILCETFDGNAKPSKTNHRQKCVEALKKACDHEVMFGFEQEYLMTGADGRPFGWPRNGEPAPQGPYYCGVGANKVHGREIAESFYRACLYCGIDIYGANAEVVLSQWEFQTGPTLNIKAGDDLWMARWLLTRIAEDFGVSISFHPKLIPHLNGSGMHSNYSTNSMRGDDGLKCIEEAIKKLEKHHQEHIKMYDARGGRDNKKRLTGLSETSSIDKFTWGVADRGASVRIPREVAQRKKGFLEDRRPAANADPYQIINAIVTSTV